nr:DUF2285 domain-containing protein [Mesorhizobium ciceri]
MLPLIAERLPASSPTPPFELSALPCRATVLQAPDKSQHVLLRNADHALQLAVSGANILHPVCLHTQAHLARGAFKASTEGTGVPQCSQSRATFLPPRLFAPEKRGVRLSFVLRALDGSLAGAPHRELAEVLIGQRRVHADWADPRDHLRDRIRRAVSRGRALMNGGYRDFLI